jgi:hypothetical protein
MMGSLKLEVLAESETTSLFGDPSLNGFNSSLPSSRVGMTFNKGNSSNSMPSVR